mgnify:CR=1 FL=1
MICIEGECLTFLTRTVRFGGTGELIQSEGGFEDVK